jgi:hypothetical protein
MAGLSKRKKSKEKTFTLLLERRSDAIRVEEERVLFWSYIYNYKIRELDVGVFGGYLSILSVTS